MENNINAEVLIGVVFSMGIKKSYFRWFSGLPGNYKEGIPSHCTINSHRPSELFITLGTLTSAFNLLEKHIYCIILQS